MNENKFTPGAEEVLRLAQEAAGELGHGYVGTEHLLLGLMREEDGLAHAVLTEARHLIGTPRSKCVPVDMSNDVAEEEGMVCGGQMTVLIEGIE